MQTTSLRHAALIAGLVALGSATCETPVRIRRDRDGDPYPAYQCKYLAHGGRKFDPAKRRAKNRAAKLSRKKNRR